MHAFIPEAEEVRTSGVLGGVVVGRFGEIAVQRVYFLLGFEGVEGEFVGAEADDGACGSLGRDGGC